MRPSDWVRLVLGVAALLFIVPAGVYIRYLRANRLEPRFAKERAMTPSYFGLAFILFAPGLAPVLIALRVPDWLVLGLYALSLVVLIVGAGLTFREWPRSKNSGEG